MPGQVSFTFDEDALRQIVKDEIKKFFSEDKRTSKERKQNLIREFHECLKELRSRIKSQARPGRHSTVWRLGPGNTSLRDHRDALREEACTMNGSFIRLLQMLATDLLDIKHWSFGHNAWLFPDELIGRLDSAMNDLQEIADNATHHVPESPPVPPETRKVPTLPEEWHNAQDTELIKRLEETILEKQVTIEKLKKALNGRRSRFFSERKELTSSLAGWLMTKDVKLSVEWQFPQSNVDKGQYILSLTTESSGSTQLISRSEDPRLRGDIFEETLIALKDCEENYGIGS